MQDTHKLYIDRLRASGIRPTQQRILISKILFNRPETFHFTIANLKEIVEKNTKGKISLATIYNTVYAFKKSGFLKEVSLGNNKNFFDTNTKNHHHFYDEETSKLIDIENENVCLTNIPKAPSGKKISGIEITIRIASSNQSQKIIKSNK